MAFTKASSKLQLDKKNTEEPSQKITSTGAESLSHQPIRGASGGLGAFLGSGSKLEGKVLFSGPVEIDCEVEGEITAKDRLTLGESSKVKAKIVGREVLVKGKVEGDITASERLILRKPAVVVGNIKTPSLTIEEGVLFEGSCIMDANRVSKDMEKGADLKASSLRKDTTSKKEAHPKAATA